MLPATILAMAVCAARGAEINDRELESLDAAARRYRVQIYETYRLDRDEFDRRKAAGDAVQARWRAAGGRKADLSAVLKWLEQAGYSSQPGMRQALPTLPVFGASGDSWSERSSKSDPRPSATEWSLPTEPDRSTPAPMPPPPRDTKQPYVQLRPAPLPKFNGYEIAPPRQFTPPAAVQSVITPPAARQTQRQHDGPAPVAVQPRVGRALLPAPWEVVSPAPSPTAGPGAVQAHRTEVGLPPTPMRVERPVRLPATVSAPAGTAPGLAAAMPAQASPTIKPVQEPKRKIAQQTTTGNPAETQLNIGELLARASGYGFGLRTIDSVLQEQTSFDPAELSHLLSELEALVDQRGDLMLYEQLVSADVRERLVRSLDFPQTTVAALGSRIAAARERLAEQSGLAVGERESSLQALADLSRRLSRLSQN